VYIGGLLFFALICIGIAFGLDSSTAFRWLKTTMVAAVASNTLALPLTAAVTFIVVDRVVAASEEERWQYKYFVKINDLSQWMDRLGRGFLELYELDPFDWQELGRLESETDWDDRRLAWDKRVKRLSQASRRLDNLFDCVEKSRDQLGNVGRHVGRSEGQSRPAGCSPKPLGKDLTAFMSEIRSIPSEGPWSRSWKKWIDAMDTVTKKWAAKVRSRIEQAGDGKQIVLEDLLKELEVAAKIDLGSS